MRLTKSLVCERGVDICWLVWGVVGAVVSAAAIEPPANKLAVTPATINRFLKAMSRLL